MRLLPLLTIAIFAACILAAKPQPDSESRFQLVGFSSTPVLGDAGVLGMTAECQNDFAESRMCTSVEVLETVSLPVGLSGTAWVRPSFQPVATGDAQESVLDAWGRPLDRPISITCLGWSRSTNLNGLKINATGGFETDLCTNPNAVACCALVP